MDHEHGLVALRRELAGGIYRTSGYRYFTLHEPKERAVIGATPIIGPLLRRFARR